MGWEVRLISFEVSDRVAVERTLAVHLFYIDRSCTSITVPRVSVYLQHCDNARLIWLFGRADGGLERRFLAPKKTKNESNRIAIINGIARGSSFRS